MIGPNGQQCLRMEASLRDCTDAMLEFMGSLDAERDSMYDECNDLSKKLNDLTFKVQRLRVAIEKGGKIPVALKS